MQISLKISGVESPIPQLLISYAREAHGQLTQRPITRREPMLSLLFTVTAGEAVVNRLLEPLVPDDEWAKLERHGPGKKWVRLATELGIASAVAEDKEPLLSFIATTKARHQIVHYKHTPNRQTLGAEPMKIGPGEPVFASSTMMPLHLGPAEDALDLDTASRYYPSFETLARLVLDAYETKDSNVVFLLRAALDGKVREMPSR